MKKFKRIFYPIYLIFALGFVYLSIDSLLNIDSAILWFDGRFAAENQPYWILTFFLLLSVMMLAEIIAENVHLHQVKQGTEDLEDEIVRLKAKLFDQSDEDEDEDEDDDEDDEDEDNEDNDED